MKPRQILPESSLHNFSLDSETALLSEVSPGCWDGPSPASSLPDESPGKNLLPALLPLSEHKGSCSLLSGNVFDHSVAQNSLRDVSNCTNPNSLPGNEEMQRGVLPSFCTQGRAGCALGQGTEGQ